MNESVRKIENYANSYIPKIKVLCSKNQIRYISNIHWTCEELCYRILDDVDNRDPEYIIKDFIEQMDHYYEVKGIDVFALARDIAEEILYLCFNPKGAYEWLN